MLRGLISCLAVMLFTLTTAFAQSPPDERPRLKHFGSSLDRLKWDDKKQAAVEKKRRAKPGEATDDDVIRIETNLVVCEVQVRDSRGKTVTGLTKDNFIITEDNQRQQIQHFSLGNDLSVGRTIILLIDYSDSQTPYIETSVKAAKMLVDQLGPKDIMAIVTDDVELKVDFTRDKDKLKKGLDSLKRRARWGQNGRSQQFSALMATAREMFIAEDLRRIIIFQTDGDEVFALRPSNPPVLNIPDSPHPDWKPKFKRQFSLRDVYQAVEKSRASVYTVIPGMRSDSWWHLAAAGAAIGGWTVYLQEPEEASIIYSAILDDINSRYVIGYYPANKEHDGKRRTVLVEVRDHPKYSVTGRKSYFAPEP